MTSKPSPAASKRVLVRRIFFDLIGLPPTKEQVDEYLNDTSDRAWENLVDRLLASDAAAERLGATTDRLCRRVRHGCSPPAS